MKLKKTERLELVISIRQVIPWTSSYICIVCTHIHAIAV